MNREAMLAKVAARREPWDILVVGGGATGLGAAVDAASRGYATLLVEQGDFAKGTSSRSTKLIHGGVRYLQQGNIALVLESLHERGVLMANAPHLVRNLSFVVPNYDWWEGPFYGIGLKLYDMLAGDLGLGPSRHLSRAQTLLRIPTLEQKGLRGGVVYHDGQFDDARLAITLMQTLEDLGGSAVNYLQVTGLQRDKNLVAGVTARDLESAAAGAGGDDGGGDPTVGTEHRITARAVINATGVWCDALRAMDDPGAAPIVTPSQGAHIVLDRAFQPGTSAIMVPHTDDGRVLFAVPWHGRVVVGTTDTPLEGAPLEPRPLAEEIDFLLEHAARYLARDPRPSDILSCFAGIRPLVKGDAASTASLSRDHTVLVSTSGLVSITGGKWTTYRRMGRDAVNAAAPVAGLPEKASRTETLHLHGYVAGAAVATGRSKGSRASSARGAGPAPPPWDVYGADASELRRLAKEEPALVQRLHPRLPYRAAHVVWAARREMARTVEDVLARRTRALLLDARASVQAAPRVAELLARELGRDAAWRDAQVEAYAALARGYLP
jgi:glycerol-3-phosphate dehydrogenase